MSTIQSAISRTAKLRPDQVAMGWRGETLTYAELEGRVARAAEHLHKKGLAADDTVAIMLNNTPRSVIAFLALACIGARVIPLEPQTTVYEIGAISADIAFTAVIFDQLKPEYINALSGHMCISASDLFNALTDGTSQEVTSSASPDDVFLYHYTSGTTGKPKAAVHSQENVIKGGTIYQQIYDLTPSDSILVPVPLAHSFGMIGGLMASIVSGSRLILIDRFQPQEVMRSAANERATVLIGVPLMYDLIIRSYPPLSLFPDALRLCLSSGAPLRAEIANAFRERYRRPIYQIYGSTETGIIAAQWECEEEWPKDSVGRAVIDVHVRFVDERGADLPPTVPGTMLVKTSTMCMSYHGNADEISEVFRDGWYVTGDMGWQDAAGRLFLQGRKGTFINVGGLKVNPVEVEEVVLTHPLVSRAVVYAADGGAAGYQVEAAVVLLGQVPEAELASFCRQRLPAYKVPRRFHKVDVLPRTGLGKTRRSMSPSSGTDPSFDSNLS